MRIRLFGLLLFTVSCVGAIIAVPFFIQAQVPEQQREQVKLSELNSFNYWIDTARINERLLQAAGMVIEYNDSAWDILRQNMAISRLVGYLPGQFGTLKSMALMHSRSGREREAIQYYLKAIQLAENNPGDIPLLKLGWVYNNVITIFYRLNQLDKANEYLYKARAVALQEKNIRLLAAGYTAEAALLVKKDTADYSRARLLYLKALKTLAECEEEPDDEMSQTRFIIYGNLFTGAAHSGRRAEALVYLDKAWALRDEQNQYYREQLYYTTGQAYLNLKDYDKSIYYTSEAIRFFEKRKNYYSLIGSYSILTDAYIGKGDYKKAVSALAVYNKLKDSMLNEQAIVSVRAIEARYQSLKKDKELAEQRLLNSRNEMQLKEQNRWIWTLASFILLAAMVIILLLVLLQRKRLIRRKERELLDKEKHILRLNTIMETEERERERIGRDLHDGIGGMIAAVNLNLQTAIRRNEGISDFRDFVIVENLLQSVAKEVRKTAHNLIPDALAGIDLTEALEHYCALIRQAGTLDIQLLCHKVPRFMGKELSVTLYRMVQELIQNIIRHSGATRATVQIRYLEPVLSIQVEDNGKGFDAGNEENKGVGLKNIQKRAAALRGSFYIESVPEKGTTAFIELELKADDTK